MGRKGQSSLHIAESLSLESGDIYQLVYFSTNLIPPLDAGGRQDIQSILEISQSRNRDNFVTGALTYNEFHFAQVLEGPRRVVDDIFASIKKDRRHTNVIVVEEQWIEKRDFADWAMAYVGDLQSLKIISPNLELCDVIKREDGNAVALVQMMRFFLNSDSPRN